MACSDVSHKGADQRRTQPPADPGWVAERVIDPNVIRLGADGLGVFGVVAAAIPLAPTDIAAVLHYDERMRGFLTGHAPLQIGDLLLDGRPGQIPLRDMRLRDPGSHEV
jgi:hypothetical protein